MKNKVRITLAALFVVFGFHFVTAQHFTTVWTGSPFQPMAFIINAATIDGINCQASDEIAVFDDDGAGGEICVGTAVLTGEIVAGNFLVFSASTEEGGPPKNGFTPGNTIVFKIWDASESTEITSITITYNPAFDMVYTSLGTALAGLEGFSSIKTTALSTSGCPGAYTIPIEVENIQDVTDFNLTLGFTDTELTYTGYQNSNAALSAGTFTVSQVASEIILNWTSSSAITILNGSLVELLFTSIQPTDTLKSNLIWNTTGTNCEYLDINGAVLPAVFNDGIVTVIPLPYPAGAITGSNSVCQGTSGEAYQLNDITHASSYVWAIYPLAAGSINGSGNSITIDWSATFDGNASLSVHGSNTCGVGDSSSLIITVQGLPTADAGYDAEICEDSTYQLNGIVANQDSIEWTGGIDGNFDNPNIVNPVYNPGPGDIINGSVTLTLTVYSIAPCAVAVIDQMILSFASLPVVNAGNDADICENDSIQLNGAAFNYNTLLWTSLGNGSFNNNAILDPIYAPNSGDIAAGSVTLVLTASSIYPCSKDISDTVVVDIQLLAVVYAGSDTSICEDASTFQLSASAANQGSLNWTTSGDGLFDDTTLINATYTIHPNDILAGSITLTLTATSISPCADNVVDDMVLSFVSLPTADAGPDASICENENYQLSGTATNEASVLWTASGGTFDDPTLLNAIYTPDAGVIQAGTVDLILTSFALFPCSTNAVDTMTLTIGSLPIADAGNNDFVCVTNPSYTLSGIATNQSNIIWSTAAGDGFFNDTTLINATYTPGPADISNGFVVLTLTAFPNVPCTDTSTDNMILFINQLPLADAGPDDEICLNTPDYQFTLASANNYLELQWTTSGDGSFVDSTLLNPVYLVGVQDRLDGYVDLILKAVSLPPCNLDAIDTMRLTFAVLPTADAGTDASICENETYQLTGIATDYSSVLWSSDQDGVFSDSTALNPTYTPGPNGISNGFVNLTLTVDPIFPCTDQASDTMTLSIGLLPVADAGPDDEICLVSPVFYYVAGASSAYETSVLWVGGDGSFDDSTLVNPTYFPGQNDIANGFVVLTMTAYAAAPCSLDSIDSMILTFAVTPTADAGADADICEDDTYQLAGIATNYASVLWTPIGDGFFSDSTVLNPIYTPGASGISSGFVNLVLTANPNYPCIDQVSDTMTLSIGLLPVANAGPDDEICLNTTSYVVIGATSANYSGINWGTSGDGYFIDPSVTNPEYIVGTNDIINGMVTLTITAAASAPCVSDSIDSMILTFALLPTADAGLDAEICEDETYQLSGTATDYSSILWTSDGNGEFSDSTILNPIYTPGSVEISSGVVNLALTVDPIYPCTDQASDTMTLSIGLLPIANAGPDDEICLSNPPSYNVFGSSASNYTSLLWTTAGDGNFNDSTLLQPVYYPGPTDITNGSVVLSLTAYAVTPCINDSLDSMTLVFSVTPTADAGIDAEICENDTYQLSGTATNYLAILWTSDGDGDFSDSTIVNPIYTPGPVDIGNGFVNLTLTVDPIYPCVDQASDTMILSISLLPIVDAGMDDVICIGTPCYTLASSTAANTTSVFWATSGDGTFNDSTLINPTYCPGPGDIVNQMVYLSINGEPIAPCTGIISDTMLLEIQHNPTSNAGDDAVICEDESYTLNGSATNYDYVNWTSNGDGNFDNILLLNATYTPGVQDIENGEVTLRLYAFAINPCTQMVSDNMILTIIKFPTADAGDDAKTCEDTPYTLEGTALNNNGQLWTTAGDGTFDDSTLLNATYVPGPLDIENGQVVLTLTAYSFPSCPPDAEDSMTLFIDKYPEQPGTPDGPNPVNVWTTPVTEYVTTQSANATSYKWYLEPEDFGTIEWVDIVATVTWNVGNISQGDSAHIHVVAINDGCGEVSSDSLTIHLDITPGIYGIINENAKITISPNPNNGRFNITIEGVTEVFDLFILNANGQFIQQEKLLNTTGRSVHTADISSGLPGIYILKFVSEKTILYRKVLVK